MLEKYINDDIYNLENVAFTDVKKFYIKHYKLLLKKVSELNLTKEQKLEIVNDIKLYDEINNIIDNDGYYFGNKLSLYHLLIYEITNMN